MAGPSPALCQPRAVQRNRGPNFPNSSTTAQLRINVINTRPPSPASTKKECEDPAALGASLGVGPAPKAVCQNESATPPLAPFLRGTAPPCVYLWALFRHTSAGKNPARSVSGTQSAAVPAAGADSVSHRRSVRQLTSPPRIRAASHRLRRSTFRISDVASYLNSKVSACSRRPLYPAQPSVHRSHPWAVPAQAP